MNDIEKLFETLDNFAEDSDRLVSFNDSSHAFGRAFNWFLNYAKYFEAQKTAAAAELAALRARVGELERDLESGFMQGAYARLKNLQDAERERDELRTTLKWAMYIIENEVEATDKTKHDFATAALAKGAK